MSVTPIQLARISNSQKIGRSQSSIALTQARLQQVQDQLTTGRRINAPSDDPGNATVAIQLQQVLDKRVAYADNLTAATSQLSQVDNSLANLTALLQQAKTLASANVGSDVSADQRNSAAAVVQSIYTQVLAIGNSQFGGTYLFAGDKGNAPPYVEAGGGVSFVGSSRTLANVFDDSKAIGFTVDPQTIFGGLSARTLGSTTLDPALTANTRLSDLAGAAGNGVSKTAFKLSNGSTTATIDLTGADTAQDVVNRINAATVGGITASLSGDHFILSSAVVGELITVSDIAGGTAAKDLGITATSSAFPVTGQSVAPKVTNLTPLGSLFAGAGLIGGGGIQLSNGTNTATVSLAGLTTVEDLLNKINQSGVGALARINANGTGIDIVNSAQGLPLSVGEAGGTIATQLGVKSFSNTLLLSDFNNGQGVRTAGNGNTIDFTITAKDGSSVAVDIGAATTVADVLNAINAAGAGKVTASLATTGTGIVLTDVSGGIGSLTVASANLSNTAEDLGINGTTPGATLNGRDTAPLQTPGVFSDLLSLLKALQGNSTAGITHAAAGIQSDLTQVINARGANGAAVKSFQSRADDLKGQNLATESLLSDIVDTDYTEATTRYTNLQTILQANYQTTSKMLQTSLLDYLR